MGRSLGLFCVSAEEVNVTKQNASFRFTDEEMEVATTTDLPDLLEHLGYHVKQVGQFYTTREMDSLRIKDRRTWKRYSNGKGGDAITFLQEFCGKGFREAVDYLLEFNGGRARDSPILSPRAPPQPEERPEFVLPPANVDNRRVFAYLRKRGIASQVIRAFLNSGLLYEDEKYHNCVFHKYYVSLCKSVFVVLKKDIYVMLCARLCNALHLLKGKNKGKLRSWKSKNRRPGKTQDDGLFLQSAITVSVIISRKNRFCRNRMKNPKIVVIFYRKGEHGYD